MIITITDENGHIVGEDYDIEMEISYSETPYIRETYDSPEELGDIDILEINVIRITDGMFNDIPLEYLDTFEIVENIKLHWSSYIKMIITSHLEEMEDCHAKDCY